MEQQLQIANDPYLHNFERLPEESFEEYTRFCSFLMSGEDVPYAWLAKTGKGNDLHLLDETVRNHWTARRDELMVVKDRRRRQAWLSYIDGTLEAIGERRAYLLKRIQWGMNAEGIAGEYDNPEKIRESLESTDKLKNGIKDAFQRALRDFNADTELALRVLYALSSGNQLTINNNQLVQMPAAENPNKLSSIQAEWGPVNK